MLSNVTRHLKTSCWMSTKPEKAKPTSPMPTPPTKPKTQLGISSFCTSPPAAKIPKTDERTFVPSYENNNDFTIQREIPIIIDLENNSEISNHDIPENSESSLENSTAGKTSSKNLLPPAGQIAITDDSGR